MDVLCSYDGCWIPAEVFATVGGINLLYQYWVHTEHIPKLGWLEKIFITPSNHRVHHAKSDILMQTMEASLLYGTESLGLTSKKKMILSPYMELLKH